MLCVRLYIFSVSGKYFERLVDILPFLCGDLKKTLFSTKCALASLVLTSLVMAVSFRFDALGG